MSFDSKFLDTPDHWGPFNGVFFVLNLGQDNYSNVGISEEYEDILREALANAHADGWAVIYVFDNTRGIYVPPECFEIREGIDFYRLSKPTVGYTEANFSKDKSLRRKQFESMLEVMWKHEGFKFLDRQAAIAGLCKIGGEEVLLPVTQII